MTMRHVRRPCTTNRDDSRAEPTNVAVLVPALGPSHPPAERESTHIRSRSTSEAEEGGKGAVNTNGLESA